MTARASHMSSIRTWFAAASLALGACVASANGVPIDQQPLVVAQPLPPNILFIMDDSGSMAFEHMPGTTQAWADGPPNGLPKNGVVANDIRLRAANINTQWYDPSRNYRPWVDWDGSPKYTYSGGAQPGDVNPRSAPWDPSGALCGHNGTFDLGQTSWPSVDVTTTRRPVESFNPNYSGCRSTYWSHRKSDLWRYQGFYFLDKTNDDRNDHYKRFDFRLTDGAWQARICDLNNSGAASSCSTVTQGPTGRSIEDEVQNYANWFSYYRLRVSMAKAASSRAFADLGDETAYRVGYDTINNNRTFRIPVASDNGLFREENKETWFNDLFQTRASGSTPLHNALIRAGDYFSETEANGPWGPESGNSQLSCRQNFSILTTDGYWNSRPSGSSGAMANNDGTEGSTITGPNGATFQYTPEPPYSDNRSQTLADVAMYYWKNDLRTDLKNDVPTGSTNPAFWQHMVTFGISIGEKGTLDPASDLSGLLDGTTAWPAPGNDKQENIDDLWHAAINSRGEFIVASDADAFIDSLSGALGSIASRLGSGASLAANSTRLEEGTRTFQAQYWSGSWRGELNAYSVDSDGVLSSDPIWRASEELPSTRNIWFYNPQGGNNQEFKAFTWNNLSNAQKTALQTEDILNYVRGDRSLEESQSGGSLRARASALGDIVNSQPVFVGAPNPRLYLSATFSGASDYAGFAANNMSRTPVVYVGANDGMLHGFNADTGVETFAFVPNTVIQGGLAQLADPDYEHQYFVDGELTVADVYGSTQGSSSWRTILVGTLGRGGRGIFALDVTDPNAVSFLWEKTADDIPELGNVLGKPVIAQVADGEWRVLIGNGPNGNGDEASLVQINVFDGTEYTVSGTGASGSNGLSGVYTWDTNGDAFIDRAYAGDLQGNVWRFGSLSGTPTVTKLFQARDSGGTPQPITAAPLAGRNPDNGELWVFVGTGQYLNQNDLTNNQVQSWYGLIDSGSPIGSRNDLLEREILAEGEINGFGARVIDEGDANDLTGKDGWYMDLESPVNGAEGERMVVPNRFQGPVLIGTTRIPDPSDPCSPSGRGFVMAIDPFTGARLTQTFFDITMDGLFNNNDRLMVNGELAIVSGIGFTASPNNPIFIEDKMQVSLDDGTTRTLSTQGTGADAIRQSWREIIGQ